MVVCQGGKPTLLTDIVDGELKRVRQDICDTSEQIAIYKQKLAAEKREGNKQLEDLLHSQYKLMNTLQELERTLLSSQAQSSLLGGMAARSTVRKWGSNIVNVRVRSETTDPIPAQLYLTVGESDQATSGRVMEADLRDLMHGLPTNVPIMVCEDPHAMPMKGSFLPRDPYGLSQKHFKAGLELIIWPDEKAWHWHEMDPWDAAMLHKLKSAYNIVSSSCQHLLALLTTGVTNLKED